MIFLQSNQEKKLSKSKSQPNILDVDREEIENNVVWTLCNDLLFELVSRLQLLQE